MGLDFGRPSNLGWTSEQQKALSNIPHVTGSLSILGSAFIMYDVLSDRKKWSNTYHRILFAMAIFDFLASWAFMLSTVPMPDDTENVYNPIGNVATCTAQGFFMNLDIASPIYNFSLAIYFLLKVTFSWSKYDIKRKIEPWLHGVPIIWSLSTTFIVLGQGGFNDSTLWCWVASYPKGCHNDDTCTRCPLCTVYYRWFFFFGPLWISAFGTMVVMSMLVYNVHKIEKKAVKWSMKTPSIPTAQNKSSINDADDSLSALGEPTTAANTVGTEGTPEGTSETRTSSGVYDSLQRICRTYTASVQRFRMTSSDTEEHKEKGKALAMTQKVTGQAFRYSLVFWVTWLPCTVNRIVQLVLGRSYFWLMFLHAIFTPMQGFLNFIVYIYLRVRKYRKEKKKARDRARAIEAAKSQHGDTYTTTTHTPTEVDDEDEFDENDL